MNNNNSQTHTSWNCKYHIAFAPKYRRKIFYNEYKVEIGKILRELFEWKNVNGKSSFIIHQRHGNLKYKYGNRSFWCRGYYVDTAGKNTKRIAEYIKNQLKEDKMYDQISFKEYENPFTGRK